jgi:hypothetical protein
MKAYLITTGTIFGIIAIAHLLRAVDERQMVQTDPVQFTAMAALGALAAVLSVWAWKLLLRPRGS